MHRGDDEAGALRTEILKKLFAMESNIEPVTLLLLKDIIEDINDITGQAENCADIVGRILILHS